MCWLPKLLVRRGAPWRWYCLNFWRVKAILCVTEKNRKKAIPELVRGLPESVRVGICQYSNSGSPRIGLGSIPIWGPTYTLDGSVIQSEVALYLNHIIVVWIVPSCYSGLAGYTHLHGFDRLEIHPYGHPLHGKVLKHLIYV